MITIRRENPRVDLLAAKVLALFVVLWCGAHVLLRSAELVGLVWSSSTLEWRHSDYGVTDALRAWIAGALSLLWGEVSLPTWGRLACEVTLVVLAFGVLRRPHGRIVLAWIGGES